MSPQIFKKYSLKLKKEIIEAKQKGLTNQQIIQKFGLKEKHFIYKSIKEEQLTSYPNKIRNYSLETKQKVVMAIKTGLMSNSQIVKKFNLSNKSLIYAWLTKFKITDFKRKTSTLFFRN
ncbi:transposase ['Cynodon dactylon' phytoplasma]|nr:transposase ['Cynodon dactylon' phytoplasma]